MHIAREKERVETDKQTGKENHCDVHAPSCLDTYFRLCICFENITFESDYNKATYNKLVYLFTGHQLSI